MKAVILVFALVAGSLAAWRYAPANLKRLIRRHAARVAWPVAVALAAVVSLLFFSTNYVLRLL